MPTPKLSDERREENRRQEWEDRDYWSDQETLKRQHEVAMAHMKLVEASKLKLELAKVTDRRDRVLVRCVAFLAFFGRPIPDVLENLLGE